MDALRATALEKEINRQLGEHLEEIRKDLLEGCTDTDSLEEVVSKMVLNAVILSVKMSAGLFFDVLINQGLIEPDDEQSRRSILKPVR